MNLIRGSAPSLPSLTANYCWDNNTVTTETNEVSMEGDNQPDPSHNPTIPLCDSPGESQHVPTAFWVMRAGTGSMPRAVCVCVLDMEGLMTKKVTNKDSEEQSGPAHVLFTFC